MCPDTGAQFRGGVFKLGVGSILLKRMTALRLEEKPSSGYPGKVAYLANGEWIVPQSNLVFPT